MKNLDKGNQLIYIILFIKQRRKEVYRESNDSLLDWQAAFLGVAVVLCLIFVIVVAYISLQQVRQIKKLEKRLNQGEVLVI